jgi:hypothetical protein
LIAALEGHVATLKVEREHRGAEIDTHKAQLAGTETRDSEEAARTTAAIAAFDSLAHQAMAAQHAIKPYWRRPLRRAG